MDITKIDNVEFIDRGVDMYIWSADYDGVEMTHDQIDEISADFENVVYLYNKTK